jgi:bla regulator protein BlaR1
VEERERACDEDVLRQADPHVYAEGILNVCKFYLESPLACASGVSGANLKRRIEKIVAPHITQNLDWRRKLLLVVAGTAAIAVPIAAGILNAPARAQSRNAVTSFEVASVKPSTGNEVGGVHVFPGGRIEFRGCTPWYLIQQAFQLQHFQVSGGPAWLQDDPYDIVDVILTSVQELGLKLQSSRGPVETIVVDHIEKPSAN